MPGEVTPNIEDAQEQQIEDLIQLQAASEHEHRSGRLKKILGGMAVVASVFVASGIAGSMAFPAKTNFGPHKAEVTTTLDSNVTLDFGAIGSIVKPVDWWGGAGAHLKLNEIPINSVDDPTKADFTEEDINNYARLFANYEGDAKDARNDALTHALTLGGAGVVGALSLHMLLGSKRRQELSTAAKNLMSRRSAAALITGAVLVAPLAVADSLQAKSSAVEVSNSFDGTILEGASIKGRLLQVIVNKYGAQILDRIEENNKFYDEVSQNLSAEATDSNLLKASGDSFIMLFYTDNHCNVGMAKIIGEISKKYDAQIVASGGDDTMSGLEIESKCIEVLSDRLKKSPRVVASGNHDSDQTEDQLRKAGYSVLDGKITEVGGLRFLGDDDPRRSVFGQQIAPERDETIAQMSKRLAEIACQDTEGVDVLLVHDPEAAKDTVARSCAKMVLGGHLHKENVQEPENYSAEPAIVLVGASAGGAGDNNTTLGPLQNEARVYAIEISNDGNLPLRYQVVSIQTDASVVINSPVLINSRRPVPLANNLTR